MVCNMELVHYLHLIHYVGFIGAQFLNSVLVFLILTKAETVMGHYRYAMLMFTLCSMLYSFVEILCQPVAHMKGSMFVVFMDSHLLDLPKQLGQHLTSLHCVLSGFVASLLACQFIYRYLALCETHLLVHLQGKKLSLIFLPALFVFLVWHIGFFYGMPNTVEKQEYLYEELYSCFNVDSRNVAFVGPMYWSRSSNGDLVWKPIDMIASLSCSTVLVGCFVTIVLCGAKIYMKMKEAKHHLSAKTLDVNKQLFRMLTIQTIIPMITMYTPVTLFVMLPIVGKDIPYLGNLTSSSLAIYPLLEPIIAITCVSSFRKSLYSLVHISHGARSLPIFMNTSSNYRVSNI